MYKQIENFKNIIRSFFVERQRYKQFSAKAQDLMIDALLEHEQLVKIEGAPIFFPADSKIAEIIYCLTQQLDLSASWRYVQKNDYSYVLLIKLEDQDCGEQKAADLTEIAFRRPQRLYSLATR